MINTTYDLFWLLAGVSIFMFTAFVCWALFYLIMTIRDLREIIRSFRRKLDLIEDLVVTIKEKTEDTSRYIKTGVDIIMKITNWISKRNDSDKPPTTPVK